MISYNTDKDYWHRYLPEYERLVFSQNECPIFKIFEWGVLHGESIKMLMNRFPGTIIIGADILPYNKEWPNSKFVCYERVDQGNEEEVRSVYAKHGFFDLIIDDGSHIPEHQAICLRRGVRWLNPGGFYIVEDLHAGYQTSLDVMQTLLAIKHLKELDRELEIPHLKSKYFSQQDLGSLSAIVKDIYTYRRSCLPLKCWSCGSSEFDYGKLQCQCGQPLYNPYDSISFVIKTF